MALVNISPFYSKIIFTQKPSLSFSLKSQPTHFCICSSLPPNQNHSIGLHRVEAPDQILLSFGSATAIAFLSASLFFADPSLAFKGGGPYGSEVTRGQDLTARDFSGKNLIKQDFKTSILRQAKFKGAKLLGASFFDADLTGADMSDADLRGADFSLANVTKVNLSNANLEGATTTGNTSFRGSVITGAV